MIPGKLYVFQWNENLPYMLIKAEPNKTGVFCTFLWGLQEKVLYFDWHMVEPGLECIVKLYED